MTSAGIKFRIRILTDVFLLYGLVSLYLGNILPIEGLNLHYQRINHLNTTKTVDTYNDLSDLEMCTHYHTEQYGFLS